MNAKKVWFVTGAGRGMGVDIVKAALAAGHAVVATGRNTERVSSALGLQGGDPAKLADALVRLANQDEPPLRLAAGADAVATVEQKAKDLLAQADAYRELSSNLAHADA